MLPRRFHNVLWLLLAAAGFALAFFIATGAPAHG